jgi:hypothetical protein
MAVGIAGQQAHVAVFVATRAVALELIEDLGNLARHLIRG